MNNEYTVYVHSFSAGCLTSFNIFPKFSRDFSETAEVKWKWKRPARSPSKDLLKRSMEIFSVYYCTRLGKSFMQKKNSKKMSLFSFFEFCAKKKLPIWKKSIGPKTKLYLWGFIDSTVSELHIEEKFDQPPFWNGRHFVKNSVPKCPSRDFYDLNASNNLNFKRLLIPPKFN